MNVYLGLTGTILSLLESLDWTKDLAELQKKAALGMIFIVYLFYTNEQIYFTIE